MPTKLTPHDKCLSWQQAMAGTACFTFLVAVTAVGEDMAHVKATARVHPIASAAKKSYAPASAYAGPGLQCKLYANGDARSTGLDVYTDDDGYARFYAVRASADDTVKQLNLDCTDSAEHSSSYVVDLASDDTFAPRPLNLATERGIDRPALKGDLLSYTQAELLKAGYGLRPDARKDAKAYSRWLKAASIPGRMLDGKRPTSTKSNTVYTSQANPWTGSVLAGAPLYVYTEAQFNVPQAIPGGDETTGTEIAIWNGLGGFGTGSGLIQGGVGIRTSASAAVYYTWREYCCGDGDSNGYGGNFTPIPGHEIYSEQWYCDANGNENLNGGYGCSFLEDLTSKPAAIFNCTQANGSPCWSVKAIPGMTLGKSAEFIIEFQSDQLKPATTAFTDFTPQVNMQGEAWSLSKITYEAVNLDPVVYLLEDFTNSTSHMNVSVSPTSEYTYFSVSQLERVGGAAVTNAPCAGAGGICFAESIAVGPNANGTTIGDPWVLGTNKIGDDYGIWHWENNTWVEKPGAATQIAVSPQGVAWVINHLGQIYYWNGSGFQLAPGGACAISIGVGPASRMDPYGSPWVIGCNGNEYSNGGIYFLNGSTWVQEPGAANRIAVSPEGVPWVISVGGYIFHWNFTGWTQVPGCATSIAVGPNTAPLAAGVYGDAWVTGCDWQDTGSSIYQFQDGASWVQIPGVATQISVSPDLGVPWVVNYLGQIFE